MTGGRSDEMAGKFGGKDPQGRCRVVLCVWGGGGSRCKADLQEGLEYGLLPVA